MKFVWKTALLGALLSAAPSHAADHADGPQAKSNTQLDIADVFAWKNAAGNLVLIQTVNGLTPTGETASLAGVEEGRYLFHVDTDQDAANGSTFTISVICDNPGANQRCTARGLPDNASITTTVGIERAAGGNQFWFGAADDPFFFNLADFQKGQAECFGLDTPKRNCASAFVEAFTAPNADFFAGFNVTAIALEIPLSSIQTSGKLFVWAETQQAQ